MYMYPQPKNIEYFDGEIFFGKVVYLKISKKYLDVSTAKILTELYNNFTSETGKLKIIYTTSDSKTATISVLNNSYCENNLNDNEYSIIIDNSGVSISFLDKKAFIHAFCTVLSLFEIRCTKLHNESFSLPKCMISDSPAISFRSLHICIFPESSFNKIRRFVRFAGFSKYTHLIIEFWGTRKFKCFKEWGRPKSLSAKQVKILVNEALAFGMELIPMINLLGHASQNCLIYGKHAVLDQNMKFSPLFDSTGWSWNLLNPEVFELHKKMIDELINVCGKGKYFHIGCDEVFSYGTDRLFKGKDKDKILINYVNKINDYIISKGRTTMMWADMLIGKNSVKCDKDTTYNQLDNGDELAEKMVHGLSHSIIMIDWQYLTEDKNLPTAEYISNNGFKVIVASWKKLETTKICVSNIVENKYFGFMQTTWNELFNDILLISRGASAGWEGGNCDTVTNFRLIIFNYVSAYLRKMMKAHKYEDSGVKKEDIKV